MLRESRSYAAAAAAPWMAGRRCTRRHLVGYVPVKITHSLVDMTVDGLRDLNMKAGQRVELELTFPESARGEWEIGCFRPGHYDGGMRLSFIVE